jgi:hypothetical protein
MAKLPLARTNAEAHLYMELQPCPTCGDTRRCRYRSAVVYVDDLLASRYTGQCPGCDSERVHEFLIPDVPLPAPADRVLYGGDDPSQLIDPGVWLWLADAAAQRSPADVRGLDEQARQAARWAVAMALAALEEVLKFIPPGEDEVPLSAFTSPEGLLVREHEPGRFQRFRLEAVRDYYAHCLAQP